MKERHGTGKKTSRKKLAPVVREIAATTDYPASPSTDGFSRRSLFYMREFFLPYRDAPKVQPLVAQIGEARNPHILRQLCQEYSAAPKLQPPVGEIGWSRNPIIPSRRNTL